MRGLAIAERSDIVVSGFRASHSTVNRDEKWSEQTSQVLHRPVITAMQQQDGHYIAWLREATAGIFELEAT